MAFNEVERSETELSTQYIIDNFKRGTFKHIDEKCKFVEDEHGNFYLNPLSGEMFYITDSSLV
jgi:hypothetical protein